jgi:hypothetical protein
MFARRVKSGARLCLLANNLHFGELTYINFTYIYYTDIEWRE